ncbi:TetR-like C-terminal domain-containing protein [Paracoccus sp. AS002]|uniref:TetR-like C-terminal domain-containing protein n=1 Tax=Paracoccus sp. AS002 TaxID=3019545 RepID=UPI0023E8093F|nr:TetR-like C-terminal domain-containing protein [Paracoccus sp. AS002]MDF3906537.1 TetR-like C-terminal domain-containing protein [Paracoccus sp. AS002]
MSASSHFGQHLLSDAINTASRIAAKTGELPDLRTLATELKVEEHLLKQVIFDREHLLVAMADVALQRLLHTITQQVSQHSLPVDQLEAIAVAYIDWARLYPQEFRLVGEMPAPVFEAHPRLLRYEQSVHELVMKILQRAQEEGYLDPEEDLMMLRAMSHTYLYGVITKMLLGDLSRWTPGLTDQDAARTAVQIFNRKMFKPEASCHNSKAAGASLQSHPRPL